MQVKASGINPVRAKLASAGLDDGCARFGETIRLSSDGANQLNGSRNWRADGDGYVGLHLGYRCRGGLKRVTVSRSKVSTGKDR